MECFVGFFELLHQRADGRRTADDNLACHGRRLIFSRLFGDVLLRGHNRLTFGRENPVDEVLRSRGEAIRLVSDVEGTRDGVITAGDVFRGRFDIDGFRTIFGVARHLQCLHGRIHRAEGDVADGSNVLRNRGLDFGRAGVHSRFDGGHINLVAVSVLLFNARQFDERGARAGAVLTGNNVDGVRQRDGERQHERKQDGSKLLHCRKTFLSVRDTFLMSCCPCLFPWVRLYDTAGM